MSDQTVMSTENAERTQLRTGVMGTSGLVLTVLATVGMMAAFMGAAPIVFAMVGPGASGTYLIATILFLVFAVGYLAMSRRAQSASGFVAFINRGLGSKMGVSASYITLLTYTGVLTGIYGAYSVFFQQTFVELFGIELPWGVWALLTVTLLGILSYNRVEFSTRIVSILLILAVLAVVILNIAIIAQEAGNGFSFAGFSPSVVFGAGFGPAMLFALGSFAGFESTAVYSEEVKSPRTTIPRATYIAVALLGGFYVISTFLVANAVGVHNIMRVASENPTEFIIVLASEYVGAPLATVLNVLVVTSFFAVLLGFTNVMSRYIFALGRAGILPKIVGFSHKKHQSPHIASLVTTAIVLVVILVFIVTNADPFDQLYTWGLSIGTVGILVLMLVCSISVVVFFKRVPGEETVWSTLVAPILSSVGFCGAITIVLMNFSLLAGEQPFAQWLWSSVLVVAVIGFFVGSTQKYQKLNLDNIE